MKEQTVQTEIELNDFLKDNHFWANGKSFRVDHLHATGAQSRWDYENIYGIYLTNPEHAWMAVYMALIDRNKFRKRAITYFRPQEESQDYLGRIAIFQESDDQITSDQVVSPEGAFIYLEDPLKHDELDCIDVSEVAKDAKLTELVKQGFGLKTFRRRGILQQNYFLSNNRQALVNIDEWQVALTGVENIFPSVELHIPPSLALELADRRISQAAGLSPENYIQ